ncbi:tripartite motif-containing protein 2-like [Patella vulgata]|uniref:tripartite motif-containing protein 2-like n=1 Tax=Patella vulgata TaxID=6465 RepID=UPI0024A886A7|nr:tripartite motif-containing protein 2-like [Patella vulgata]
MAEKTDKEVCSICLSNFQQPVKVDCHHSFCFSCLDDYVKKTSTNDQFICPLCRCLIQIPTGGVNQLRSKPYIADHSPNNIPQCDVCTEDISQYFCQDCDQCLCKSCKTMHDKLKSCKDHVAYRYDEYQIGQQSRPKNESTPVTSVTDHKEFCRHHEGEEITMYCKDCSLAMCWKCFVANHNGHNYLDLQEEEVRQNMRQDLRTLNDELETQIKRFEKHYDNLNSKLMEVKQVTKTECDRVDAQVDKVCSEFRKIGENIKKEMQKTSEEEESKCRNLMEDIKRLTEDLKASVKYSVNVLEDSAIVEVLQRLPKVRQEKDESCCRKLDIPGVRYSTFQVAEIDKTLLTNQLGKIVSCHQIMIEDIFTVEGVRGSGWNYGKQQVVSGFTWSISVTRSTSLFVGLNLHDVEDKSITSCKVDVTCKIINKNDDRQSVVKQCVDTARPGGGLYCGKLIDLSYVNDPDSGFIDDNGNFTIQVTINEITVIDRR